MQIQDFPEATPGPGEILVRLESASLNPGDYKLALAGHADWKYPHVPGLDGAGIVEGLGEGTPESLLGKRVCFYADMRKPGCFAQYICVPADVAAIVPEELDCVEAAALPCAAVAAWQAIEQKTHVQAGNIVLIQGAAGGVGSYALQFAARKGARVVATCSAAHRDYVLSLGAEETIDYSAESLKDRVAEISKGTGLHVLIDTIGSHSSTLGLSMMGVGGQIVCLSGLPDISKLGQGGNGLSIHELALGAAYNSGRGEDLKSMGNTLTEIVGMAARRELKAPQIRVIGASDIPQALETLRDRHVAGKIVASFKTWD